MGEFKLRREKLLERLPEGSLVLLHSGVSKISSEDSTYPFEVNRNFFYLTGIKQENSLLFLVKGMGENKEYLFIDEYNPVKEKWTGKRLSVEEAAVISEMNNVLTNNVLESKIDLAIQANSAYFGHIIKVFMDSSIELKVSEEMFIKDYVERLKMLYPHIEYLDIRHDMTMLRMKKSPYEVSKIKEAINSTHHGINQILLNLKSGKKERSLSNIFDFYGREKEETDLAFDTIVASGINATCLHYPTQNDLLKENDLVLLDLGYKKDGYCGDISRTYPVSGTFNELQRKIYSIVLLCNKAVIEYAQAGLTIADLQKFTIEFFKTELTRNGLLKDGEDIHKYYYHGVSHHLGLDTHDICDRNLPLEPGNIITVEPGLYFAQYGIGVRIEDDVLITNEGVEVLSRNIPKEIDEIENQFKRIRVK